MSSPTADPPARAPFGHDLAAEDIQRRRRHLAQWRRHSLLVHGLRRLLPLICAAILAALACWALGGTLFWRLGAATQASGLSIRLLQPRFQGRDEQNRPFILSAASAVRDDHDTQRISLDLPVFVVGDSDLDRTKVKAKRGVYREDTRILQLDGDVELQDAQGYRFFTQSALIDTQKNNVDGDSHIDGQGPLGRIAASAYAVRDGGAQVYFRGQVKARIESRGPAAASGRP